MIGYIPEVITYISGGTKDVRFQWDDITDKQGAPVIVTPAFVSDNTNPKTLETGRKWAGHNRTEHVPGPNGAWYDATGKYIGHTRTLRKAVIKEYTQKNDPINGIRVIGLEHRSQGGRAYKAVTPENYYVDFREDVLLDTLLKVGISAGGILNDGFIWARVGAEMKLVRVGSELHEKLVITTADRKRSKIPVKDLVLGSIYSNKSGEKKIYLGLVNTTEHTCTKGSYNTNAGYIGCKQLKNQLLWINEHYWKDFTKNDKDAIYGFEVAASHSMLKQEGKVNVPVNYIEIIRDKVKRTIRDRKDRSLYSNAYTMSDLCYISKIANITLPGESWSPLEEYTTIK